MANFTIEWRGDTVLAAAVKKESQGVRTQAQNALKNSAEKGKSISKGLAPVDTGFLRANITTRHMGEESHIHSAASYSGFQEFGTRYQPGKPFMRPMMQQIEPYFTEQIRKVMEGAFK